MIANDTFTCDNCGGTFDMGPDGEARDELKRNFGEHIRPEDCDRICDDCYEKVMAQFN